MYAPSPDRYDNMVYRRCGGSGLKLPEVSLGLWHNFGGSATRETATEMLLRAFDPPFARAWFRDRLDDYQMTDLCRQEKPVEVPLASGCFMLVPTRSLQSVGGFDERCFLYFEDFDLSLRLDGQGRLLFDPAVRIVHHGGYAARKGLSHVRYFIRSGIRFFTDHGWRWI